MPLFTTASQAFLETSWRAITSQVHLFRKSTRRCACSLPGYLRFQVAKRIARSRCRSSLLWVIPQSPSCFILSNKRSPGSPRTPSPPLLSHSDGDGGYERPDRTAQQPWRPWEMWPLGGGDRPDRRFHSNE